MTKNQEFSKNDFGKSLKRFIKTHKYSIRVYADIVGINFSTVQSMWTNDTATLRNVSNMIQKDNRLIKLVENHFNDLIPTESQIKLNEPPPFRESIPLHELKTDNEIIIELQKEVIRLNKQIIKYQKTIKNETNNHHSDNNPIH
jgi:hypothetical protein